ncbi:MAG: signal peptidase I [Bacilli bacterium]|nr:signal peptidase I [Bacilli bacterium]
MKKIGSKIMQIIPFVFFLLSIILIVEIVVSLRQDKTPTIFGCGMFLVVSRSMEDKIMTGDLIFIDTKADEFFEGDIITFRQPGAEENIITHEIVDVKTIDGEIKYTTKGYNNYTSLDWEKDFDEEYIIGKYVSRSGFLGDIYRLVFTGGLNFVYAIVILVFMMIAIFEITNIAKEVSLHKQQQLLDEKNKLVEIELEKLRRQTENKTENKED